MRKHHLLKTMLLLCALIVGSSSAWADTVTFIAGTDTSEGTSITKDGITIAFSDGVFNRTDNYRCYSGASMTISSTVGNITQIDFTATDSNPMTKFSGNPDVGAWANNNKTQWTGDAATINFGKTSGQCRITKIVVTYTAGGGSSTLDDCDLALNNAPVALSFDLYNNASAQAVKYTTSSTGAVTVSANEYIETVVDENAKTITVTPKKKTNGDQVITVIQAADDNYKAGSTTFTVTITDSTPETGSWVLTDLADLTEDDVFVIVGDNGDTYAMSNNNGTSGAPTAVGVTVEDDEVTFKDEDADNIKWNISGNATDGYTFYPNGDDKTWLYCTNTNNGVRVGTNANSTFIIKDDYLYHVGTSRYVGIYTSSDWRCYTSINSNITGQTFAFYKYVESSKKDPELSFSPTELNVTIGEDFTLPTLNTATGFNGTVEYSSSDESVARISDLETGDLILIKGGTTTITATFAGDDVFRRGSASYTLNVTDNRTATTITQDNIALDVSEIATLTQLKPVVKDANDNVITYEFSEFASIVSFFLESDDNEIISYLDGNLGEITLSGNVGTATLKAYYNRFNENTTYQPSECTFTITVENVLDNIAALTANTEAGTYKVKLTDAVVTYVNGNYAYIQDASGAVLMYKSGHGFTAGDVFNGKATVDYKLNNNNPQITSLEGITPTAGEAPDPTIVAAEDWSYTFNEVLSQYFKITGATLTQSDSKYYVELNEESIQLYKAGSSISGLDLSKTYSITGFPTIYKNTKELQIFVDPEEEASTEPSITVDPTTVDVNANEHDGTLDLTYANLTITNMTDFGIQYYDAEGEETTEPDWIEVTVAEQDPQIGEGYVVSYYMVENEGEARTAYFKVYALDGNELVYSNLVTITQAEPKEYNTYTLAKSITSGKRYVIASGTEDEVSVMSGQEQNNRAVTDGTVSNNQLSITSDAGATEVIIFGPDASGNYSIWDADNGYLYAASSNKNHLKSQLTNDMNGKWSIKIDDETGEATIIAQGTNSNRYMRFNSTSHIFSCYGENSSITDLPYLYAKSDNEIEPSTVNLTLNDYGYATYASTKVLDFLDNEKANYSAWQVNSISGTEITYTQLEETVAPGTGILLKGTPGTTITLNALPGSGKDLSSSNKLVGITEDTEVQEGEYYGLYNDKFLKVSAGTVPANRALLPATEVPSSARQLTFVFNEEGNTTSIDVRSKMEDVRGEVYNLNGQRVAQPTKGLYIVNGRKVVVK